MRTLELFAGTGSFSKVMRAHGHRTTQVELYPCEGNLDVLELDVRNLRRDPEWVGQHWPMLWASPPCQGFSVATIGRNWEKGDPPTPKSESAELGLELLESTLEYIAMCQPDYWFVENPRGMMRKVFDAVADRVGLRVWGGEYVRHTVTYCQYGDTRMKPTDIWTNARFWEPRPPCKNGAPCHVAAPRGSRTPGSTQGTKGARDRGVIPPALFEEIQYFYQRRARQ
jgi:hypothetical protein